MTSAPVTIIEFQTIDSTNSEADRRAAGGDRGPLWIRSDRQEQGRGRSGRPWSSPPGNLSATYMFTPACPRSVLHQLSFVAGIAAFDAVAQHLDANTPLQLKWPNDLLIGHEKLGGILVESAKYDQDIVVMIGIGINMATAPEVAERTVARLDAHAAAASPPSPQTLLRGIAHAMTNWLDVWQTAQNFDEIRAAWLERGHPLGQQLSVNCNGEQRHGRFAGLAPNGALQLAATPTETICIDHGDVSLVSDVPDRKEPE